jgi:methyl-accepting chemotaxis protein
MNLGQKIVSICVGSIVVTAATGLLIQRSVIRSSGINDIRETMRASLLSAESTRSSISALRGSGAFDDAKMEAEAKTSSDYRTTRIYPTVPVVAAWNEIQDVATKEGYVFRVPAEHPRNPKNLPTADEARILSLMESQRLPEYFEVNEASGEMLYARPVRLTSDCMMCHGDASSSPSGNGKDILGFPMEGWHVGDLHGAFILHSKLDGLNKVVREGMMQTAAWLLPLSFCVGLGVYLLVRRISVRLGQVTVAVTEGSAQLTSAAGQVAAASQGAAQGASEQASMLSETSAATGEITALVKKNAESTRRASGEMDGVTASLESSNVSLGEMLTSMEEIGQASEKISTIIQVIDKISFQTNILALNAAVEAARAGEAGAGFAVVAEEVRSLAMRSAEAAKNTETLIEDSRVKSRAGSVKLQEVVTVFRGIRETAGKVKTMVEEVSLGSEAQTRGIEQVMQAIRKMEQVTQSSAASAEQSAATSEELSAQAESLDGIAHELQTVVEG